MTGFMEKNVMQSEKSVTCHRLIKSTNFKQTDI